MKSITISSFLLLCVILTGCRSGVYEVTGIERTRMLIDSRYDGGANTDAVNFLKPFKEKVDSTMCPVVGYTEAYMEASRPESPLSNLLADILVWEGEQRGEKPDLGVYNMGGIRAALPEGEVTFGDIVAMAPFVNKVCIVTLRGDHLMELFQQMAATGGEGVSKEVRLVISSDGKLDSVSLRGRAIDPEASYRIATIDYLAQGNDKMTAFKKCTDMICPGEETNDARYVITRYFTYKMNKNEKVSSHVDGRVTVKDR